MSNHQYCLMLIEQRRLIVFHLLEDSAHQRFANKATTVTYSVLVAETVQRTLLTLIEQDGHFIFAGLLLLHVKNINST